MDCPKCQSSMKIVKWRGYEIDRCSDCCGLWFDKMEHVELTLEDRAYLIDVRALDRAKQFNKIRDIDCPHCKIRLIKINAKGKKEHCWEACKNCRGVFFDSGEFRDFIRSNATIVFDSSIVQE